ncbi:MULTISPECIES: vitamin K epoxide reductase family protein [Streptomyces]|uniref:vitamin K epoxide reductase family protein n=1 Tax=Streptomyces TaxID=1883 RepID=UPI001250551C|nr:MULTISPECIES: vitamin K epoxide reductase family protein [Streptomyces]NYV73633.1 vitamin K epoxide reductase family protein [Streptomyces sp. UH6]
MSSMTTVHDVPAPRTGDDGPRRLGGSRGFGVLLAITGALGVLASWIITMDKFHLLEDPDFTPACSLNPIFSCKNIMQSDQASVFGFPNPLLGLVTYAVVVCVGMSVIAGARFPRWYWLTLNAGTLFGVGFCTWLMIQSLYEIHNLCLWCMLAWTATIVMFWYVTSFNVRNGFLPAPKGLRTFFDEFTWVLPVVHIGVVAILIFSRWGSALWA